MSRPRMAMSPALRSRLFLQLATLERAGIPPLQALESLDLGVESAPLLRSARGFLAQGQSLAQAGRLSGLFTPMEAAVIAAACVGGSPAHAFLRLAEQATLRAQQGKALRGRLLLPGFVALAALLILPLPAVVAGSLSVAAYLLRVIAIVAGVAALFALGRELMRRQAAADDWTGRAALESLALGLQGLERHAVLVIFGGQRLYLFVNGFQFGTPCLGVFGGGSSHLRRQGLQRLTAFEYRTTD